jgi:DNA-binding SARP family transcriptional activator
MARPTEGDDVRLDSIDAEQGDKAQEERFQLRLLRGFELRHGGCVVRPCLSEQRLIALLTVRGGLLRSATAGMLWPDASERRAHGSLRTALWRLVKSCPGLVVVDGDRLGLSRVEVDVTAYVSWAKRLISDTGPIDGDVDMALAEHAELLPGWDHDWVVTERERLRQLRLHALEALALELAGRGSHAVAIDVALAAIALDPLRESGHRTLISLYLAEDNVSDALRQLRIFSDLLWEELRVAPSPRMTLLISSRVPHYTAPHGTARNTHNYVHRSATPRSGRTTPSVR